MRFLIATVMLVLSAGAAAPAEPQRRIFIIANHSDGYGIDRCLANSQPCGAAAADAYCKSREFTKALSYRKVDKDEITGAVPASTTTCRGGVCDEFVAIVCAR